MNSVEEKAHSSSATYFEWNKKTVAQYPLPKQIRYTLSIQNLENKYGKNVKLWIYAPANKTSHQALRELKTSYPAAVSRDDWDNTICEFTIPQISPYETKIFRFWADLGMSDTPVLLGDSDEYLLPERLIESDHALIQKKALKFKREDPYQSAKAIYDWVANTIKSTILLSEDKGALYALENLEGDCTESAALFVAMCRAMSIPARIMGGYICSRNCIVTAGDFHNWAEFYYQGSWHVSDPHNRLFDQGGESYITTEIYKGDNQNPIGKYHRYRFEGQGVKCKVKMTD